MYVELRFGATVADFDGVLINRAWDYFLLPAGRRG
jgi:hypothetical protein